MISNNGKGALIRAIEIKRDAIASLRKLRNVIIDPSGIKEINEVIRELGAEIRDLIKDLKDNE